MLISFNMIKYMIALIRYFSAIWCLLSTSDVNLHLPAMLRAFTRLATSRSSHHYLTNETFHLRLYVQIVTAHRKMYVLDLPDLRRRRSISFVSTKLNFYRLSSNKKWKLSFGKCNLYRLLKNCRLLKNKKWPKHRRFKNASPKIYLIRKICLREIMNVNVEPWLIELWFHRYLSIYLSNFQSINLFVYLSIYLFIYVSIQSSNR